jgi:hypothetical protein
METKKMSLANIQGKMSRTEMKNIMAGSDGGWGCIEELKWDCSMNPGNNQDQCCPGLKCEINGTGTGTICMSL